MIKLYKYYPFFIPLILWSVFLLFIQSRWYQEDPKLMSMALTIDFLFTVPLLYYLAIRKRKISKFTVFSVFVLGLIIASLTLPAENQFYLDNFKFFVLPFIELGVVGFIVYKTVKTVKAFKAQKSKEDFYSTLLKTTKPLFPGTIATVLATEIAMLYYGFIKWKVKKLDDNEFTYHKKNALVSIIGGLTLVIVGETIGLHKWLVNWNPIVGWIITVLSAYTAIQFFALAKSITQRPIVVDVENRILHLKYGFFSDFKVNFNQIDFIEMNSNDLPDDKSIIPFSPLGKIGEHNVIIHFKEEELFAGIYGLKKKSKAIAVYVDEKEKFAELIKSNMLIGS